MEDDQFLDSVKTVIEAAQNFLDTDAAYGADDPRTRGKKEGLARAMEVLTPSNVDVPELHVVRGGDQGIAERELEPAFRAPVADWQRWSQVRAYLTQGCELPASWIDALHEGGKIYADVRGNAVFIGENEQRIPTAAYVQGMGSESTITGVTPGARRDPGWFTARLPAEDAGHPPVLIIAESPVEALSVLEVQRRIHRDRPGGKNERGPVTVMATEGAPALPREAIAETLRRGGIVRVATATHGAGELIWEQLRQQYPSPQQVERAKPTMKDWNDDLRFHNASYRDPKAADRQLDEVQRQNPPDAQSREAVRDLVRRLGPARHRGRDDYER
jgi:hypothetical protein